MKPPLTVLAADEQQLVLDELVRLLNRHESIRYVHAVTSGVDALRVLGMEEIDAVFLDVALPVLNGLHVARLLSRFHIPPKIIFTGGHSACAVAGSKLSALGYLLKPISEERLGLSVRRILSSTDHAPLSEADEMVPVAAGGITRFILRSEITYIEAEHGYARLHTTRGTSHLVRIPLTGLEHDWSGEGFMRIHRHLLISTAHVRGIRINHGHYAVLIDYGDSKTVELPVARRHISELRELKQRRAMASRPPV